MNPRIRARASWVRTCSRSNWAGTPSGSLSCMIWADRVASTMPNMAWETESCSSRASRLRSSTVASSSTSAAYFFSCSLVASKSAQHPPAPCPGSLDLLADDGQRRQGDLDGYGRQGHAKTAQGTQRTIKDPPVSRANTPTHVQRARAGRPEPPGRKAARRATSHSRILARESTARTTRHWTATIRCSSRERLRGRIQTGVKSTKNRPSSAATRGDVPDCPTMKSKRAVSAKVAT